MNRKQGKYYTDRSSDLIDVLIGIMALFCAYVLPWLIIVLAVGAILK